MAPATVALRASANQDRKIFGADSRTLGHQDGSLERVVQLPNISRPIVASDFRQRGLRKSTDEMAHFGAEFVEKVVGEIDEILGPLAQRRKVDPDHVNAEIEIFAE